MATDGFLSHRSDRSATSSYQRTEQISLSSSRGWGKQAAQRLNTKDQFKNDPLLRTLEGKIAVNFGDYKPWQRTNLSKFPRESTGKKRSSSRPLSGLTTASVGSGPAFAREESMKMPVRPFSAATSTACSTVCNHPWTKKPPQVDDAEEKRKQNLLAILKIQIKTRQKSIAEYENRKRELLLENMKVVDQMESSENQIHGDVKTLLQKYERFRGAMSTLNEKFGEDLVVTKRRLEETRMLVNKEIAELQLQLNVMDKKLTQKNEEMNILLNYKDKEYPAKALQIAKLKRQQEVLASAFKEELEELQAVVDAEREKFSHQRKSVQREITTRVTEDTINAMGDDIKEMALQNMIMKKEVEIHRNEVKLLEANNTKLEAEIREMLDSQALNTQAQIFPEVFGKREKCTPDMELHLDIPTHDWLPI
ncbi:unnamed protein product [Porites evermanni]|uniref:Uncharacterized protein n=1 Tax=Porites evermanni TaxID=104178 RepID=A0ABN8SWK4_9CNID|nr:unnamed protein product [Porites evermanni]